MIPSQPLQVITVTLSARDTLRLPSLDEILRFKAFLVVRRHQARDLIFSMAALADKMGTARAAGVLAQIDAYDRDNADSSKGFTSQVARQLADPRPADRHVTGVLARYKRLDARWRD